jgi:hypothetical protein
MLDESPASGAFSLAELNYLRLQAMDLFERCLAEGHTHPLEAFIEEQITQYPPRLELLRDVAGDLHQRLLSLRENHFDVRDRALRTLRDDFSLDLSPLIPLNALDHYHQLNPDTALSFLRQQREALTAQDELALRKLLDTSLSMAAQLHRDVTMTEALYGYIMDWVMGLNATVTRHYWSEMRPQTPGDPIH